MEILSPNQMTLAQYIWNRIADDQVGLCRTRALHSASNLYVNDRDIQKYIEEYCIVQMTFKILILIRSVHICYKNSMQHT